jgi:sulfide:quinone oxidoreductase
MPGVPGLERVYVAGDSGSFSGPDGMPKEAHMADVQAAAAACNPAVELAGRPPTHGLRVELLCIVDARDKGMLEARSERHSLVLSGSRVFHWLKRGFERWYLQRYR